MAWRSGSSRRWWIALFGWWRTTLNPYVVDRSISGKVHALEIEPQSLNGLLRYSVLWWTMQETCSWRLIGVKALFLHGPTTKWIFLSPWLVHLTMTSMRTSRSRNKVENYLLDKADWNSILSIIEIDNFLDIWRKSIRRAWTSFIGRLLRLTWKSFTLGPSAANDRCDALRFGRKGVVLGRRL